MQLHKVTSGKSFLRANLHNFVNRVHKISCGFTPCDYRLTAPGKPVTSLGTGFSFMVAVENYGMLPLRLNENTFYFTMILNVAMCLACTLSGSMLSPS